jgi:hypothetical protein
LAAEASPACLDQPAWRRRGPPPEPVVGGNLSDGRKPAIWKDAQPIESAIVTLEWREIAARAKKM